MLRFVKEMYMIRGSWDNQKPYFKPKSIKQDCLLSNAEMEKRQREDNGLRRRCCRTVIRNRILMIKKVKLKQNQKSETLWQLCIRFWSRKVVHWNGSAVYRFCEKTIRLQFRWLLEWKTPSCPLIRTKISKKYRLCLTDFDSSIK